MGRGKGQLPHGAFTRGLARPPALHNPGSPELSAALPAAPAGVRARWGMLGTPRPAAPPARGIC